MEKINEIIGIFKNLSIHNLIDIGIGIAVIILFKIISSGLAYIIIKIFHFKIKDKKKIKSDSFYKPLKIFIVLLGIYIAFIILKLPQNINYIITKVFKICTIILITMGCSNLFNSSSATYTKLRKKFHFEGNDTLVAFIGKIAKAFIYILSGFIIITELGYNLGGLAAGLGISSVVIALAAQDIAKSILSGFSIISDKPFEIGDTIEVSGYTGTVEDITFRTTRIRDVNNQIIVLPNSMLSSSSIINGSKREKRRYELKIVLELDTHLDKVSSLTDNIKLALQTHPNVITDTIKVFFDTISDNGIDIAISFYTEIIDLMDFLRFKEEINYTLLDIIEKSNIGLAYPSQTLYLKKE